jgi:hypothetical protein
MDQSLSRSGFLCDMPCVFLEAKSELRCWQAMLEYGEREGADRNQQHCGRINHARHGSRQSVDALAPAF